MPVERTLTATHVRRARVASQLLHRPRRLRADAVVSHLVGVQAQFLRSAAIAIAARTDGLTEDAVARARVDERSVVLTWAMRGTLYLVASEDVDRFVPVLTEPHVRRSLRRLGEEGVPADAAERACDLIERMLASEGALTRTEITARLRRRIGTEGQAIAHLVWLAAARRGICLGPDRGAERTYVLVRDWVGAPRDRTGDDRDRILRDLALRYVRSHAPATADDFAAWSGVRLAEARGAWSAIARRTEEVRTPNGAMVMPRGALETPAGLVRLLPELDEYLLGWKDRSFSLPTERRRDVNAGGGLIRPVVVDDGRVVATWKMERTSSRPTVEVRPFARVSTAKRAAVTAEAHRVAALQGTGVDVAFGDPATPA